jgi:phosphoribosyl 1,2-cyclic phosphodiesterase
MDDATREITDDQPPAFPESPRVMLRVLASGSGGNCSVLTFESRGVRRVCLIDLGLSPRRVFKLLRENPDGPIRPDQIDDAIVTHLDSDHAQVGWRKWLPAHARLHVHRAHARAAREVGLRDCNARFSIFDDGIDLHPGVRVHPVLMAHDEQGVVALRFEIDGYGAGDGQPGVRGSLGFATDVGRATDELVDHLRGVNVLAIESNYCPVRQLNSPRPEFLKRRIMGGAGHLSNQQAVEAIQAIRPVEHVVLLHLSRECNCPEQVRGLHEGADYTFTISTQFEPTRWVRVSPGLAGVGGALRPTVVPRPRVAPRQLSLFTSSGLPAAQA